MSFYASQTYNPNIGDVIPQISLYVVIKLKSGTLLNDLFPEYDIILES